MKDAEAITELLAAWHPGDADAADRLLPAMYDELRALAGPYFRGERRGHTLQPTALVHEAWMRVSEQGVEFKNRAHFVGLLARVMRRVLVDHARERGAAKRGGNAWKVTLGEADMAAGTEAPALLDLDRALAELESKDPLKVRIIELRFFGGLSIVETAEVMGISPTTVTRQWRRARAWLHRRLAEAAP